jgi:Family of unknown function (DUF6498)
MTRLAPHSGSTVEPAGSTLALVAANALTLCLALALHWPVATLLWPYWLQNLVIGWYARRRMLALHAFSTEGFTSNDQPVPENEEGKKSTAGFFVLHYGFFHLVYFIFLCAEMPITRFRDFAVILACGFSYVFAQRKTFAQQAAADAAGRPNLGALMFTPYLRVLPIHLAIVLGASRIGSSALVLFVVLKTLADIGLDHVDRRNAENAAAAA